MCDVQFMSNAVHELPADASSGPARHRGRRALDVVVVALLGAALLAPSLSRAADPVDETDDEVAAAMPAPAAPARPQATTSALAPGVATVPVAARAASAERFRPAPMPDKGAILPGETLADDADQASLHPDVFKMSEHTGGALSATSSEYEHADRVKPAGGMSLSIPMD